MKELVNFRDLGGIPVRDGRRVRSGRLLRAGEPVGLPEEDVRELLSNYGLRRIVDFRAADETAKRPDDILPGVEYCSIDILGELPKAAVKSEALKEQLNARTADEQMKQVYERILLSGAAKQGYRRFLSGLLSLREGSTLFHCYAGKDRTGIGAAMVLTLLGASREDILRDYLQTNRLRAAANRAILDQARSAGAGEPQLEGISRLLTVREEYLLHAYETAEREYGSFDRLIREGIGFSDQETDELKAGYLE